MSRYNIAPIPTIYNGRQYRSRLEAKWAAFFDRLGWRHEYEPFDLGKWSPDFLLDGNLLVEVKPIAAFDQIVADKMAAAVQDRGSHEMATLLLVGTAPRDMGGAVKIGWIGEWVPTPHNRWSWQPAMLAWVMGAEVPSLHPDILSFDHQHPGGTMYLNARLSGQIVSEHATGTYEVHAMGLWADASNAVQWMPRA